MTDRNALVLAHTHLVPLTVARMVPNVPPKIDVGDLVGAGNLALCKAAERFDPGRGVAFKSLAIAWIRGGILQHLRAEDWPPRRVREQQRRGEPVHVIEQVSLEAIVYGDPELAPGNLTLLDTLADPSPGPEERALESEWASGVRDQVEAITERERRVLWWYYADGLTWAAISEKLAVSESRVDQIKNRALLKLRALWQEEG